MSGYAISREQAQRLGRILAALARQTATQAVLVTDYGGNILAHLSLIDDDRLQTVAALAAASFSATRELAGLLGETEFRSIVHRGVTSSLYMQCIASRFLVLVVLGRESTVGLVKLYVGKASRQIESILSSAAGQSAVEAGVSERLDFDETADVFRGPDAPTAGYYSGN